MAQLTMYPAKAGSKRTTLTSDLAIDGTQAFVGDLSAFPVAPNLATFKSDETVWETCLYTAKSAESGAGYLTITRSGEGHDSSSSGGALSWSSGALVFRSPTALDHDRFKGNIEDLAANKQNIDATLTALAGITTDANKLPYATGPDTFDVCDLTSFGRSLIGTSTESAIRTLIETVYSTTADMTVYVDSAATGDGYGTSWTDAFTTIQAAHDSLPLIIAHSVVILVRDGTYTENLIVSRQCLPTGSIEIRAEYYWYGTVAATKTGKITLGASDFGYDDRAQIEAGDRVIVFKWSGTNEASVPTTSYEDTVESVSGAEVTLTTNSGVSFTSACTYAIIKNSLTASAGTVIDSRVAGIVTIAGFKIGGNVSNGIYVRTQFTQCNIQACEVYGFTGAGIYSFVPISTVARSLIQSSEASATGIKVSGNAARIITSNGVRVNMTGGSSNGGYCINGDIAIQWTHIAAAAVGMRAIFVGTFSNSASGYCLNEGTIPRSPASSTDSAYIQ